MNQNLYLLSAYVSIRHWEERKVIGFRDPDRYTRLMLSYFLYKQKEEVRTLLEASILRERLKSLKIQFSALRSKIDAGNVSLTEAEAEAIELENLAKMVLRELEGHAKS